MIPAMIRAALSAECRGPLRVALLLAGALHAQEATPRRWLEAAETAQARTEVEPHDGPAWLRWGEALLELGAPAEALEPLTRAERELRARPRLRAAARFALARAEAARGHGPLALAWLGHALELGFDDLAALERDPGLAALAAEPLYGRLHDELVARGRPRLDPELGVALSVPAPPNPFRSHEKTVLAYDLCAQSVWPLELGVVALEVLDASSGSVLARYEASALAAMLQRPGAPSGADPCRLPGNAFLVAYLWLPLDPGPLPRALTHRLFLEGQDFLGSAVEPIVEGGTVALGPPAPVLAAPLSGEGWVPRSAGSWSYHRRGLRAVAGALVHPQRFAADWGRVEDVTLGEAPAASAFAAFGQAVLAVGDGGIVIAEDGRPDNDPDDAPLVLPPGEAFGNRVVLDLGGGRYATYGHLQSGSVAVRPGQHVRRGQVLARVGCSGDSSGPHLHFHLSDSPTPDRGQGLAYALETYTVLGWERYEDMRSGVPAHCETTSTDVRHAEMPVDSVVVRLP